MDTSIIDVAGLQTLVDELWDRGFTVVGPTVRDGTIVSGVIHHLHDLPVGVGDVQEPGSYRLRDRGDEAYFGFAAPVHSAKQVLFPTSEVVWRGRRTDDGFSAERAEPVGGDQPRRVAFLGVRSCDLAALGVHDRVLLGRSFPDARYAARREDAFVVAVTCGYPASTCFCGSLHTGPRPQAWFQASYDLALTELLDGEHRFVAEAGTDRGEEVLAAVAARPASEDDEAEVFAIVEHAREHMGRALDTDGLKELLYASIDSPVWDEVADRCLACSSCTMVCPTCFCTSIEDVTAVTGDAAHRERLWDSCFNAEFSYIHGGPVRRTRGSRYRQWMTHKLGSWVDQFGMTGCVGCGRCITWCPVGIDITAEAAALRSMPLPAPTAETR
jgi:ferredoxin